MFRLWQALRRHRRVLQRGPRAPLHERLALRCRQRDLHLGRLGSMGVPWKNGRR